MDKAKVYVQVLGVETEETSPSLMMCTPNSKIIFNTGEGLIRSTADFRTPQAKHVFYTHLNSDTIEDFTGM